MKRAIPPPAAISRSRSAGGTWARIAFAEPATFGAIGWPSGTVTVIRLGSMVGSERTQMIASSTTEARKKHSRQRSRSAVIPASIEAPRPIWVTIPASCTSPGPTL